MSPDATNFGKTIMEPDKKTSKNLVEVDNLTVEFTTRNGIVQAVSDVSFHIAKGETLAKELVAANSRAAELEGSFDSLFVEVKALHR